MTYKTLLTLSLMGAALLCGCGNSTSPTSTANSQPLTSNWQWTMADPVGQGTLTGGFLQQNGNSVTGSLAYTIYAVPSQERCAGGSAQVTGTVSGQMVTLTAVAAGQTYSFAGTLATTTNGSTITGTYSSTTGATLGGSSGETCGVGQKSLSWSAISLAPLSGAFQGSFHSNTDSVLSGQDFPVTGTLTQGENIGSAYATLTGTLSVAAYPCLSSASLNGTISGSSIILSIIGTNGLAVGSIGSPSQDTLAAPTPALLQVGGTGRIVLGLYGSNPTTTNTGGYQVTTGPCPLLNGGPAGDFGNVCLGLGTTTACEMPISFSPTSLTFPQQILGSASATQSFTLTNTDPSGQSQTLTLELQAPNGGSLLGDFNGQPNFTEQDTCGLSPFALAASQSCTVYISFSPQESCPWNPATIAPLQCPSRLNAAVSVTTANSQVDGNSNFSLPMSGTGLSAIVPSAGELDFSAEDPTVGEESESQFITFTNQALYPVQILPSAPCILPLPDPLVPGVTAGLQVVSPSFSGNGFPSRPGGNCDGPPPNSEFPLTVDNCSGVTLQPQQVCTLSIASKPIAGSTLGSNINYLELNTLQCVFPAQPSATNPCEIDAGRFPVTLNRESHSNPIRLIPAASLTFSTEAVGSSSAPQSITVFNDPKDSKPGVVTFQSIALNGLDYAQTNTCGATLAVGESCTITTTFTPTATGLRQGTVVITTPASGGATIYLRGTGK